MRFFLGNVRTCRKVGLFHSLKSPTFAPGRLFRTDAKEYASRMLAASEIQNYKFWKTAADDLVWDRQADKVVDDSKPEFPKWFPGGQLNMCYNCVDRHVIEGRGDMVAVVHESPAGNLDSQSVTFAELLQQVKSFSGLLKAKGVQKGDRVVIYCPMIIEAAVAMLSCARIGAIHSVVFGGFAAKELSVRIDHAKPKAVVSSSHGFEGQKKLNYLPLLEEALELAAHEPDVVIVKDRGEVRGGWKQKEHSRTVWLEWEEALSSLSDSAKDQGCAEVEAMHPLYLLYTSGTTGQPKGIVRPTAGYAVALRWSMQQFMGMRPNSGDCYWAASDIGWVVGHSYCVYGPLLNGNKTVMFEGKPVGTPDPGAYWKVVEKHAVKKLFTAPTALRAIRKADPNLDYAKKYSLASLETLFTAGERGDPPTVQFFQENLELPVVDHYWQSESGFPIVGFQDEEVGCKPGSSSKPLPGFDVRVLDSKTSQPLGANQLGDLVVKLPLPPGALETLYLADDRFLDVYMSAHPGYYSTHDAGYMDEDGYVHIMARTDDVINTAGHRLSTGAMEEVLMSHSQVADCAVVGKFDELKSQVPVGFIVKSGGSQSTDEELKADVVKRIREVIGPVASFKEIVVVDALPKTRSGKTLRNALRSVVDGQPYVLPGTVENPGVMKDIEKVVELNFHNSKG